MNQQCYCNENELDLITSFPEQTKELDLYMNMLDLSDDIEKNRGFLIQSLHKAQECFGYLHQSVQVYIARKLKIHLSEVYSVISFYSYFTDIRQGELKIKVCTGTACFVKGTDKILNEFSRHIGIKEGETTKDMKYSLDGVRCVGACSLAPVVLVNEKVYANVTTKMFPNIIAEDNK